MTNLLRKTCRNPCKHQWSALFLRCLSHAPLTKAQVTNGIKRITLNSPKNRNAMSFQMMEELHDHILADQDNVDVRVVVITAEGPVFSAGHNLKELSAETGRAQHELVFNKCTDLMLSIMDSPVPIVTAVDGLAAAAGCQLVLQSDISICTPKSSFSTPGANFGIFCSTPGIPLARCVQQKNALYMLLTGLPITSSEAERFGIVSKVVPDLEAELEVICTAIVAKSRSVIELGKKFYYKQIKEDVREAYRLGGHKMVENLAMEDGEEGVRSFIEKRKAKWRHTK